MTQDYTSPFHAGETAIQERLGVKEAVESFASKAIRNFMPDQHRTFFAQLPFMVVGSVDGSGYPWATLLCGTPGFVQSPDDTTLAFSIQPSPHDPVSRGLNAGNSVGLLGIELPTRRRNRANGLVSTRNTDGFRVQVQQSFGNCPKYIQKRDVQIAPGNPAGEARAEPLAGLDDEARTLIAHADTFFVATFVEAEGSQPRMVDVSHRGGRPGFVREENGELTIPDFRGNLMFCTLGNILRNPKAGLVFPDFENGHMLVLSGAAEILWDLAEQPDFKGAERFWRFRPQAGFWLRHALTLHAEGATEFSPFALDTGSWDQASSSSSQTA